MCPCHLHFHQWLCCCSCPELQRQPGGNGSGHTQRAAGTEGSAQAGSGGKHSPRWSGIRDRDGDRGRKSRMAVLEGSPMHRLASGHWGTNTLDPQGCVLLPVWWEGQGELCDPGKMLQEAEEMEKGPCFAPSDTCSINYSPKTILWCHASWMQCSAASLVLSVLSCG